MKEVLSGSSGLWAFKRFYCVRIYGQAKYDNVTNTCIPSNVHACGSNIDIKEKYNNVLSEDMGEDCFNMLTLPECGMF